MSSDPFADGLPVLRTERLGLRHPRESDLPELQAVFSDREALRYWSHGPLEDAEAAREYLGGIQSGWQSRTLFQWAITQPPDDRLIGTFTLTAWDRDNRRAEVGFMLARSHWGRGLGREAVAAGLTFGFDAMQLHRIEADVHPANHASIKLLVGLGFREEGRLRERWLHHGGWSDSVMMGLLDREFGR